MRPIRPLVVVLLLSALVPARALGQSDSDKTTARELGEAGETALDARDFKGAEDKFKRANALYHAPTLILGLARAQAGQGRFVEAWESYHSIILENVKSPPVFASALADAQKEILSVEARRAKVTITVTGASSPSVTLDDTPLKAETLGVPRFIDPGTHVVKGSAAGYKTATQSLTIPEGGIQTVTMALATDTAASDGSPVAGGATTPESPGTSSWGKTASYVAFGVGGAGLIEGIITGVLAIGKHSDLAKVCTPSCPSSDASELSSYHTMGTLSTVGFIVGGIGVAGGVTLFLTAPKAGSPPASGLRLSPTIGFGSAGVAGSF